MQNETMIANHIKNQLEEDFAKNQFSLNEFADLFMSERNSKKKQFTFSE